MSHYARTLKGGASKDLLLCLLTMVLTRCAAEFMSRGVFPRVSSYSQTTSDAVNLVWAALLLVVYFIARNKASLLDARVFTTAAICSAVTAGFVLCFGLTLASPVLTFLGVVFLKVVEVWSMIVMVVSIAGLRRAEQLASVTFGIAIGEAVSYLIPAVSPVFCAVCAITIYAIIVAILHPLSRPALDAIASSASAEDLELVNPESFVSPVHPLVFCIFLFSLCTGYGVTFGDGSNSATVHIAAGCVLMVIAVWMSFGRRVGKEDDLFWFCALLVTAGLVLVPYPLDTAVASTLIRIGVMGFLMLMWLVALAIGTRSPLALLPVFTLTQAVRAVGIDAGGVLARTLNAIAAPTTITGMLVIEAVLLVFIAFLLLVFRRFSFTETIQGIASLAGKAIEKRRPDESPETAKSVDASPTGDSETPQQTGETFDARIAALGAQHGLTARETEIFALLARGRNGQYITESLVIARSTMKTHVKHIYAKLDVHSQQELIDLVEKTA